MTATDKIWSWYVSTIVSLANELNISSRYQDDIISDVLFDLSQNEDRAIAYYQNVGAVRTMLISSAYGRNHLLSLNKRDYTLFKRYEDICERFQIPFDASSAYKISRLSDDKLDTIAQVYSILSTPHIMSRQVEYIRSET